jgi:transcriptional regulator with XRE-family HTH domain
VSKKSLKDQFGATLKRLRVRKGVSQGELAKSIGVEQSMISLYENGKNFPDSDKLATIANFFKVDFTELLSAAEPPGEYHGGRQPDLQAEIMVLKNHIIVLIELIERGEATQETMIKLRKSLLDEIKLKDAMLKKIEK